MCGYTVCALLIEARGQLCSLDTVRLFFFFFFFLRLFIVCGCVYVAGHVYGSQKATWKR